MLHSYVIYYNMVKRHITSLVQQSLNDFPSVLLNGARQVGKSTLAQQLVAEGLFDDYVTLDDLLVLEAAETDPEGFISQYPGKIVVDEIQRVPKLLIAIKKKIDEDPRPGRYLLTGSANVLSYPKVAESLAGRMDIISLEGLSLGELYQRAHSTDLLNDLFDGIEVEDLISKWKKQSKNLPLINKESLCPYIFFGGFPTSIAKKSVGFSERWFSAYLKSYVERDVRDLSRLLDVVSFSKLFRLAGNNTGNLLNIKKLGSDIGIDQRTVSRYIEILTMTFQINLLNPWFGNAKKRLVKTPKVYCNDSGFACFLAGINQPKDLMTHSQSGALAETWLWSELRKILVYLPSVQAGFYRTHQGKEVDFLLSKGNRCVGIEFKWTDSIRSHDFNGLKDMQSAIGPNTRGIVLYTGKEIIPYTKDLFAVPVNCLLGSEN